MIAFIQEIKTYIDGDYRTDSNLELKSGKPDYENSIDTNRRIKANLKFVAGKNIADFDVEMATF